MKLIYLYESMRSSKMTRPSFVKPTVTDSTGVQTGGDTLTAMIGSPGKVMLSDFLGPVGKIAEKAQSAGLAQKPAAGPGLRARL
jgi:hypothetical protein